MRKYLGLMICDLRHFNKISVISGQWASDNKMISAISFAIKNVNASSESGQVLFDKAWQGPTVLAVVSGGGCLDIFSLIYHSSFLSPPLWETARCRHNYFLYGPLSYNQPNLESGTANNT